MAPALLLPTLIPANIIPPGSLICSLNAPHHDVYRAAQASSSENSLQVDIKSLTGQLNESKSSNFSAALTQLLKTNVSPSSGSDASLSTKGARQYEILGHREIFANLKQNETAISWLDQSIKNKESVYLVTGIHTIFDIDIQRTDNKTTDVGAEVTVPLSEILTAGAALPLGNMINPSIGAEFQQKQESKVEFLVPGEMIWAMTCKKIKFEWFKRKDFKTARLGGKVLYQSLAERAIKRKKQEGDENEEKQFMGVEDLDVDAEGLDGTLLEDGFLIPEQLLTS